MLAKNLLSKRVEGMGAIDLEQDSHGLSEGVQGVRLLLRLWDEYAAWVLKW